MFPGYPKYPPAPALKFSLSYILLGSLTSHVSYVEFIPSSCSHSQERRDTCVLYVCCYAAPQACVVCVWGLFVTTCCYRWRGGIKGKKRRACLIHGNAGTHCTVYTLGIALLWGGVLDTTTCRVFKRKCLLLLTWPPLIGVSRSFNWRWFAKGILDLPKCALHKHLLATTLGL